MLFRAWWFWKLEFLRGINGGILWGKFAMANKETSRNHATNSRNRNKYQFPQERTMKISHLLNLLIISTKQAQPKIRPIKQIRILVLSSNINCGTIGPFTLEIKVSCIFLCPYGIVVWFCFWMIPSGKIVIIFPQPYYNPSVPMFLEADETEILEPSFSWWP